MMDVNESRPNSVVLVQGRWRSSIFSKQTAQNPNNDMPPWRQHR